MTEKDITALLFEYFRFTRKMHCVSQISVFYTDIEDFIAFNNREIYCIEIKTDKRDFISDFKVKDKHKSLMRYDKFYFCVPIYLVDFAKDFLKGYPRYGLLVTNGKNIRSIVRVKENRHTRGLVASDTYNLLVNRMSSELAREKRNSIPKREER
jgi:hypothetical protein|nr:MAG TPA: DNA repair protein MmcB-like protein [Caudoviricetes sp.]